MIEKSKDTLNSINKMIDILETFDSDNLILGIEEMSKLTGYPKTTVHRIVQTLVERNWLVQDQTTKKYGLGFGTLRYEKLIKSSNNLINIFDPIMKKIRDELNETVVLSVYDGGIHSMCIHVIKNNHFIQFAHHVGAKMPLYAGAVGRCILAFNKKINVLEYLEKIELKRLTDNTITNKEEFLKEINKTRENGYAISISEVNTSTLSICAPIIDNNNEFIACVNIACLDEKNTPEFKNKAINLLKSIL